MTLTPKIALVALVTLGAGGGLIAASRAESPQPTAGAKQEINLAERLASGKLRAVNREAAKVADKPEGVRLSAKDNNGVAWVEGTDFATGTIELDIRGKDVMQQSFVGVAFHRKDDSTYEAVYLRPFNFRATDAARVQHAVQYISVPDYDWPRLRKEFPEEFENPVNKAIEPTGWVHVRLVVQPQRVQIFVGPDTSPTLEVRKLGTLSGGTIGLWAGNTSDVDYRNLRLTPAK